MLLSLTPYIFLGCVKQDKVSSLEVIDTTKVVNHAIHTTEVEKPTTKTIHPQEYGQHTDEIQEFLSATPLGSEIYLEQKESGEWYLKIEKTFTAKKDEEKTEMNEPIYGESILI